jgi:hypothetical protein
LDIRGVDGVSVTASLAARSALRRLEPGPVVGRRKPPSDRRLDRVCREGAKVAPERTARWTSKKGEHAVLSLGGLSPFTVGAGRTKGG